MQMMATRGAAAYRRVDTETRSPLELVVMLYDGALRFVDDARDAGRRQDLRMRAAAVSRALAIVAELQNTLNLQEGGTIAEELDRLYTYLADRLLAVTTEGNLGALDEVQTVLSALRDGWAQVASGARA
jgi:flagellar protein FliS